jgi:hypothetical protein
MVRIWTIVAEADAARLVGGLADHLVRRDVGARVLLCNKPDFSVSANASSVIGR